MIRMTRDDPPEVRLLVEAAERFDSLAETADLMGDRDGAASLKERAASYRLRAMRLLDE
jgi:hypothetical protein